MIKDVCNQTIDFSKIERVGAVLGDQAWLTYEVYFVSGHSITFYHEREYYENKKLNQIKREDFIKMWKESNNYNAK